tara:strand:- start:395 stop:1477 length:1083 start_codon:yes stop_codon:yes gene_type:complete
MIELLDTHGGSMSSMITQSKKHISVLSLFNGMSFGKMALEALDVKVDKYYSSEIDKYANQATQALFPDTIQLGDVTKWRDWDIDWASIDLVTGGFPCQAWSMAGKQLGDKDERGMLFWTMLDIIKHVKHYNPKSDFLIENVKMKKEFEQYITTHTENALSNVHKILINSALVSAQNRNRYYWTSFAVDQPEDKGILLNSIIESGAVDRIKSFCIDANYFKGGNLKSYFESNRRQLVFGASNLIVTSAGRNSEGQRVLRKACDKSPAVTARYYKGVKSDGAPFVYSGDKVKGDNFDYADIETYRKLTPRECFRLQTVPEHHIDTLLSAGISNSQLYKMCGNGWTMEVIKHIFKHGEFANHG